MESDQVGGVNLYNWATHRSEQCGRASLRSSVSTMPSLFLTSSMTSSIHHHDFQYHRVSPSLTPFGHPIYASVDPWHPTTCIMESIHSATQKSNDKCYPPETVLVSHNSADHMIKNTKRFFPHSRFAPLPIFLAYTGLLKYLHHTVGSPKVIIRPHEIMACLIQKKTFVGFVSLMAIVVILIVVL